MSLDWWTGVKRGLLFLYPGLQSIVFFGCCGFGEGSIGCRGGCALFVVKEVGHDELRESFGWSLRVCWERGWLGDAKGSRSTRFEWNHFTRVFGVVLFSRLPQFVKENPPAKGDVLLDCAASPSLH